MGELWFPYDPQGALEYFETRERYTTGPAEVRQAIEEKRAINLVDVRRRGDYDKGHIAGAISLPEGQWGELEGLKRDQTNIIYCYTPVCHLAMRAAIAFARQGFPVCVMEGGFQAWQQYQYDVTAPAEASAETGAAERPHSGLDEFTETRMESRHSSSWPHS